MAVLLPGAYYTLRDTHLPPIEALRAAGVPMAVSTDHNPGTSPALSLLLMVNMACTLFRLTVPEALAGVTAACGARAGLAGHAWRASPPGMPANFVLWNLRERGRAGLLVRPAARCAAVVRQGRIAEGDAVMTHSSSQADALAAHRLGEERAAGMGCRRAGSRR